MATLNSSFNNYKFNNLSKYNKQSILTQVSFGMKMEPDTYNITYSTAYTTYHSPFNGEEPDSYILQSIKQHCPNTDRSKILDLGSGDGRNTIPVAKIGYNVTGIEISETGRNSAMCKAKHALVTDRVSFKPFNLLERWTLPQLFDYAFLSHVSMHFNNLELLNVFTNLNTFLKQGGIFALDALLLKEGHHLRQSKAEETNGISSFSRDIIMKIASRCGFEHVESAPFQESGLKRASYEQFASWGRNLSVAGETKRPVELTWLSFRKISPISQSSMQKFIKFFLK